MTTINNVGDEDIINKMRRGASSQNGEIPFVLLINYPFNVLIYIFIISSIYIYYYWSGSHTFNTTNPMH